MKELTIAKVLKDLGSGFAGIRKEIQTLKIKEFKEFWKSKLLVFEIALFIPSLHCP